MLTEDDPRVNSAVNINEMSPKISVFMFRPVNPILKTIDLAENQDEILDTPKLQTCRICLESGKLITPCNCKGSSEFVHETCLSKWIISKNNPSLFYSCEICLGKIRFRYKKRCLIDSFILCVHLKGLLALVLKVLIISAIFLATIFLLFS